RVPARAVGAGPFVIGDSKVRPRLSASFRRDEKLGIFLKTYNFKPDGKTNKPTGWVDYEVVKNATNEKVLDFTEDLGRLPGASAQQVTIEKRLPLAGLEPGRYRLKLKITDRIGNQTLTSTAGFTVN